MLVVPYLKCVDCRVLLVDRCFCVSVVVLFLLVVCVCCFVLWLLVVGCWLLCGVCNALMCRLLFVVLVCRCSLCVTRCVLFVVCVLA